MNQPTSVNGERGLNQTCATLLRATMVRVRKDEPCRVELLATIEGEPSSGWLLGWLEKLATFGETSLVVAVLGEKAMTFSFAWSGSSR